MSKDWAPQDSFISRASLLSGFKLSDGQKAWLLNKDSSETVWNRRSGATQAQVLGAALHAIDNPGSNQVFIGMSWAHAGCVKDYFLDLKYKEEINNISIKSSSKEKIEFDNGSTVYFASTRSDCSKFNSTPLQQVVADICFDEDIPKIKEIFSNTVLRISTSTDKIGFDEIS